MQGERKKRGQRSLGLRAEVFQPKGAEVLRARRTSFSMTLSEERPAGFLHLVASAPPRSKTRPAVVFLQAEIMFLKSPEGSFAFLMH